jgi:bacteriocin-like protein
MKMKKDPNIKVLSEKEQRFKKRQLSDEELKNINGGNLDTEGLYKVKCFTEGCLFHLDTPVTWDDAVTIAIEHERATRQPDGTEHCAGCYPVS